ncbi:hypothetical protein HK099_007433 [Clydaea vesicula]|uniref:Glycolipid transfer protein domain-containing protein n=1 Tax=Clydaea vesicula TaxID=447962 RepID=A0AAD5U9G8_9FUNG|nr:hypothetical protein HK099_007433 [Clydaea vesicula]KAJ3388782.1 hypothetical protein HDU92_001343 [Lobulomyces angularis]
MSQTFFDNLPKNFTDVTISASGEIDVLTFLEATESMLKLFDVINATAFSPVKSDMTGNISKIRTKFLENPANSTLQAIVLSEQDQKKKIATEGLLWLKRGLEFTSQALRRNVDSPDEELTVSFGEAYKVTLSKFHSFIIKPVFAMAMKACPYRKDFYAKLGDNQDKVKQDLNTWLTAFEKIVKILSDFYTAGKHDKGF